MANSDTEVITSGRDYFNPLGMPQDRWMVTIPTAEKLEDNKGNPYVMYSVIIESDDCIWCVKRRYSEFKDLQDKLENLYPKEASRLNLPPRKFGGTNFKQEFINERRLKLQDYLNDIISSQKLFSSPEFTAFIEKENRHNLYIHRNQRKPDQPNKFTPAVNMVQNAGRARKPSIHLQQIKYWVEGIKLKTLCDQPPVLSTSDAEVFVGFDRGDIVTYLGEYDENSDTLKVDLHGSTIWVHRNQVALFNLNDALSDDSEDEGIMGPKSASPIGRPSKGSKSGQMRLGGFRSYSAHTLSDLAHSPTGTLFLSKETEAKVNRTKSFFDDYYRDLYRYHEQRKKRQDKLEEQLRELGNDGAKQELLRKHSARETALLRKKRIKMKPEDYQIIDMIGKGGFGKVYLARDKETSEVVALKKIKKSIILQRNKVESIRTEREVLKGTMSPWLIKLICSFQDRDHLYFAMEYAPGGNLKCLLDSFVLPEESARFYVSEMILAVKSLHQLGFVHRDLKPDNFLFDIRGHIKLADFGLSKGGILKKLDNKTLPIRIYMQDDTFRTVALTSTNSVEEIIGIVRRKLTVVENVDSNATTNVEFGLFVVTGENEERQLEPTENVMTAFVAFGIPPQFDGRGSLDLPSPRELHSKKYPYFLMKDTAKKTSTPVEEVPVMTKPGRSRSIGAYLSVAPEQYDRLSVRERRQQANQTFLKHAMYSFVGSPHYMAPEIIMKVGYDHLVDWWSIGCILYEMIVGVPPFLGDTPHEVFGNILDHEKLLTFPEDDEDTQISELTKDLIKKLLSPASTRLGKKGGCSEIQAHPYFSRIDWSALRELTPPFVPKLTSPTDTSYFHMAPEDKRSDSFTRSTDKDGLDSGSIDHSLTTSYNNNTDEDVLHEGLRTTGRNRAASHASIDSSDGSGEDSKGKKFYIPKKKGHKRNQSYDFVGFTYKPQSWMEISELAKDQVTSNFTNFESD
eukprot:CAMPEP_0168549642 /NCGR_PEP_ID=MMETSP0413-20121227/5211_1 /TAXON_ID=136452 /ORGANISM="Filamoeba nolandi, Strain NC-AS-23-1" /LENGTH=963 /DNA_ID=CAMNT_0008580041 /DNA_START=109 /DNA_END=3000 /DNA_ORIENTATION=-